MNPANDGSANDIAIATPHLASQEFSQAVSGSVVIYELDTPTVTAAASAPRTVAYGSSTSLSSLVTASDPSSRPVSEYQVYDVGTLGAASDAFLVNGATVSAHSAGTAITTSTADLASTYLQAANATVVDTLMVRAYNGAYWGDWASENVAVLNTGSSPPSSPMPAPVLAKQTSNQVWMARRTVDFELPTGTFIDPQGSALSYSAAQVQGRSLGLTFDSNTQTFTGTIHGRHTVAEFKVTATDAAGLSTSEYFKATIASNAAQFSHAVSAMNGASGIAASSLHEILDHAAHTLHRLWRERKIASCAPKRADQTLRFTGVLGRALCRVLLQRALQDIVSQINSPFCQGSAIRYFPPTVELM